MVRYASRKDKEVARDQAAVQLVSSRFRKLPPWVELLPGQLRIDFFGTEDFLLKFGTVVFALNNDFEQISAFIESAAKQLSNGLPCAAIERQAGSLNR